MQTGALMLAILGLFVSIVPTMGESQMAGVAMSMLALVVAVLAGQRARTKGMRVLVARVARWVAVTGIVLSLAFFATCQVFKSAALEQLQQDSAKNSSRSKLHRLLGASTKAKRNSGS
jgi:hypothetical protein